jgi:hypothetical protein
MIPFPTSPPQPSPSRGGLGWGWGKAFNLHAFFAVSTIFLFFIAGVEEYVANSLSNFYFAAIYAGIIYSKNEE